MNEFRYLHSYIKMNSLETFSKVHLLDEFKFQS